MSSFEVQWAAAAGLRWPIPWRGVGAAGDAGVAEDILVDVARRAEDASLLRLALGGSEVAGEVYFADGGRVRRFLPPLLAGSDAGGRPMHLSWPDAWSASASGARLAAGLLVAVERARLGRDRGALALLGRVFEAGGIERAREDGRRRAILLAPGPERPHAADRAAADRIRAAVPFAEVAPYLSALRAGRRHGGGPP